MRVIITGGSGMIGRALTASLAGDGHEVIVLSRRPDGVKGLPAGARAVGWDGRTPAGWGHLVEPAGAIVNLAGANLSSGLWTAKRKRLFRDSRVQAGEAVVAAVRTARVKPEVVIQSSGVGHYGPCGDVELDEGAGAGDDFQAQLTLDWEASTRAVEEYSVRRAITRSGVVLSRAGGALPLLMLPFRFFAGGPMGRGRQWMSWIHITDEVRAIRFLIDCREAQGVFNLCTPQPVTNRQFGRILGRVMHRPSLVPVPAPILRLVLGELSVTVLEGQRVLPRRLLEHGFHFRYPDLESALRDLLR